MKRPDLPLASFIAVLALILGFAYGATFDRGCETSGAPFGCIEFFLNRYQALIAIAGALLAAYVTAKPVWHQLDIMARQLRSAQIAQLRHERSIVRQDRNLARKLVGAASDAAISARTFTETETVSFDVFQKVFLPNMDEEQEKLKSLHDELKALGIEPWGPPEAQRLRGEIEVAITALVASVATRKSIGYQRFSAAAPRYELPGSALDDVSVKPAADALDDLCRRYSDLCVREAIRIQSDIDAAAQP